MVQRWEDVSTHEPHLTEDWSGLAFDFLLPFHPWPKQPSPEPSWESILPLSEAWTSKTHWEGRFQVERTCLLMAAVSAFEESLEESEIQGWETEPGFPLNWLLDMARQTLHSSYSSSSEAPSQEGINLKGSRMRFEPFCDVEFSSPCFSILHAGILRH